MIWPEKKNKNKSTVKWETSGLGSMHLCYWSFVLCKDTVGKFESSRRGDF